MSVRENEVNIYKPAKAKEKRYVLAIRNRERMRRKKENGRVSCSKSEESRIACFTGR